MEIGLPSGSTWKIEHVGRKLELRATLPGARVFDLVAQSLRAAKTKGVSAKDRLALALPASWLVNSPANSRVLRRWALPPHCDTCLAFISLLETDPAEWAGDPETTTAMNLGLSSLGAEPNVTEALSKALALLVPDAVPLMPDAARSFVLGANAKDDRDAFARVASWFARTVRAHRAELEDHARAHREVELGPAGVLDRLLWFDSEGHAHFPRIA
jgi:hypothetical protein